jgi:ferric-dicitrate binding protein FerR (iron transport regulator)
MYLMQLYIKYLLGECTKEQFLAMKDLLSGTSDEKLENMMKDVWDNTKLLPAMPPNAKQKIKLNIDYYIRKNTKRNFLLENWRIISVAVACIFIFIGYSIFYSYHTSMPKVEKFFIVSIDRGQKATVELPDNSSVHLNAETELKYDINDDKNRKVYLHGEAFFKVKKDKSRPFIVSIDDELQIEVIGTSFNVQTYNNEDFVETSLIEGNIKLTSKRFTEIYFLKPMQQFIYSKKDASTKIVPLEKDSKIGWISDYLLFTSEPLYKIIHKIERWYGVNIDLQYSEIRDDLMSGSFYKEDLKSVLEAIKIQYDVEYSIKGNQIIISKTPLKQKAYVK